MKYLVFATQRYEYLKEGLCRFKDKFEEGLLERRFFADGERYQRIASSILGRDAIVIGGTIDDTATLELYDLASGLVNGGVNTLSLVIPYYGYSTQERAVKRQEVVTAKARAVLLSSVPQARLANEIIMMDLHTEGIAHYFEGHVRSVSLSARSIAKEILQELSQKEECVVACTDAGRAKWVQALANDAGLAASFVYKSRTETNETYVTGINADVNNRHVVIYDDMVRSGGSLIEAAKAYKAAGATKITAITTHAVLPGESLTKIQNSGLFTCLHCTDSHPRALELEASHKGFIKLHPVAGVFANYFTSR